jgi:hypothetical protein
MAQTLKFGNGTWATKKGSTLAYNDEDGNYKPLPFNYTGAGKGTRVNKEGLIEVVENDRPRIDYLDSEDGVFLLEKASTNLVKSSGDISTQSTYWLPNQGGTSVQNATTAPDGSNMASQINTFGQQYGGITQGPISVSNTEYTYSIYLKAKNGTPDIRLIFFDSVTFHSSDFTISSEWKRYDFKFTPVSGSFQIYITCPYVQTSFYTWGAQLEQGSYPTSYIPTQGSIQTRVAETASGSGNSEVFNSEQGVLFANIAALTSSQVSTIMISLSNGSSSAIRFGYQEGTNLFFVESTGTTNNIGIYSEPINSLIYSKISLSYKENDVKLYINGFLVATDTLFTPFTSNILNKFNFDGVWSGVSDFYGKTKEIGYYDEVLTDLELETLTSYRTWESMVKELNLNVIYNG